MPPHLEEKYTMAQSCLWALLSDCPMCMGPCQVTESNRSGTFISLVRECPSCVVKTKWSSQPMVNNVPSGNIGLSASILFSGASPTKVLRVMDSMNLLTISESTFHRHSQSYLQPTINTYWTLQQQALLEGLRRDSIPLQLGGDCRSDSPGHSAKYGSYTMIETRINKIIDIQLVQVNTRSFIVILVANIPFFGSLFVECYLQSNEVGSSVACEKEGLRRSLHWLAKEGLEISVMVTDRSPQVNKYLREEWPDITHYFDVWHVSKGKPNI